MAQITYYGHNCFMIESDSKILTDPYIRDNPLAAHIDPTSLKPDFILLTHGHSDHVADVKEIAENSGAKVIGIVEVINWVQRNGYQKVHKLNFGGTYSLSPYSSVKLVQAVHSSSLPDGSYGGHPGSFILQIGDKTIFLAGDTVVHMDMQLFGTQYDFDLAILPIGGNFTMDLIDAIKASELLRVTEVIGCHYDTFPVIRIDHDKARNLFTKAGLTLHLMDIGQTSRF